MISETCTYTHGRMTDGGFDPDILVNFDTRVPEWIVSVLKNGFFLPNVSFQLFGKTKITDSTWFEQSTINWKDSQIVRPHQFVVFYSGTGNILVDQRCGRRRTIGYSGWKATVSPTTMEDIPFLSVRPRWIPLTESCWSDRGRTERKGVSMQSALVYASSNWLQYWVGGGHDKGLLCMQLQSVF